jgi:hypothetical protein
MGRADDKEGGLQTPCGGGESQGGAYPGRKRGRRAKAEADSFMGHGGQSVQGYQGPSNPNATSKEDESNGQRA